MSPASRDPDDFTVNEAQKGEALAKTQRWHSVETQWRESNPSELDLMNGEQAGATRRGLLRNAAYARDLKNQTEFLVGTGIQAW